MTDKIKGIDVSCHNGKIDWKKVKQDGIEFAILRCGYGNDIRSQDDNRFAANVEGCEENGIPWGAYLYSYATDLYEAENEAKHILRLLKNRAPLYPVYLDMEDSDGYKRRYKVSDKMCADICAHVCHHLTQEGYLAGVYANKHWLERRINDKRINQYQIWLAQWNDQPTYNGSFGIWQYTNSGMVNGIDGRVDMDYCFVDYPSIIKSRELNGYKKPSPKPPPAQDKPVQNQPVRDENGIKVGDTVLFKGGPVYTSSTAKLAAGKKSKAACKVTIMASGAPHPYHCIGGGVYGWVDAADVTTDIPASDIPAALSQVRAGDIVEYSGRLYADSYGGQPGKTVSGRYRVDRVIEGREYGIHIPAGWIKASDAKKVY